MANRKLKDLINLSIKINQEEAFKQDIYYLVEKVFSLSLEEIILNENRIVDDELFQKLLSRYLNGEPLYYLLNEAPFCGRLFYVDNSVLIPRNETEELVYLVIDYIRKEHIVEPKVIDIGTGSGCIAITLDLNLKDAKIDGVDISLDALKVAKYNQEKLNSKVNFFHSDCLNESLLNKSNYDIIVSNPPYIDRNNFVEESVLKYEPHIALFAENRGLAIYEKIFGQMPLVLNKHSAAFFEISPEQEKDLIILIKKYLPDFQYKFVKDINDFVRFLILSR